MRVKFIISIVLYLTTCGSYSMAQEQWRIGILIGEYGAVSKIDGGHTSCCENKFQLLNSIVVEQEQNKHLHRFEGQRIYMNNFFGQDGSIVDLKGISVGYNYLYAFKKLKPVNLGIGLNFYALKQNWDIAYGATPAPFMAVSTYNGLGPDLIAEANLRVFNSFYICPSLNSVFLFGNVKFHGYNTLPMHAVEPYQKFLRTGHLLHAQLTIKRDIP